MSILFECLKVFFRDTYPSTTVVKTSSRTAEPRRSRSTRESESKRVTAVPDEVLLHLFFCVNKFHMTF